MKSLYLYIGGTVAAVLVSALLAWFIFASSPQPTASVGPSTTTVGSGNQNASDALPTAPTANTPHNNTETTQNEVILSSQKVFKISGGPVAGATFVQASHPTTTLARWVMADTGHAYDLPLDGQGTVPKLLSNTTIPGAISAHWGNGSAVLQYLDGQTPKTVYLGLPGPNATSSTVRLQFLPDGILSLAVSPDGTKLGYTLQGKGATTGYVSTIDGSAGAQLFSLPLIQLQLVWPAQGTLLAYSNASAGVPGIAFGIDAKSGAATPLVYAPGLTATADGAFAHVLYQTVTADSTRSYSHDVVGGGDRALSLSPLPEQCVPWQAIAMVCAASLGYVSPNYLDQRHQGSQNAQDALVIYNLASGTSTVLAVPGSSDGGVATDMLQLVVSPDGRYALFVSKNDRSLWGVRLGQ